MSKHSKYQVAAYYYPGYHPDPANDEWHGKGWTEWDLMIHAKPRFDGHDQPKVPMWGYQDESQPEAMAQKIDAAADHAIDVFLFDWYWYETGPFLYGALDNGFLHSPNSKRIKFALMWANHSWANRQPAVFKGPWPMYVDWQITADTWERATDYIIQHYFPREGYWTIDGRPYFSIYSIGDLLKNFGDIAGARRMLDSFDAKARAAGWPGIHFNMVEIPGAIQDFGAEAADPETLSHALGFSSVTNYVNVQIHRPGAFPKACYPGLTEHMTGAWREFGSSLSLPYHPNVTMGWDSSPRTCQSDKYENIGYPFMYVYTDNTPANFKAALVQARLFLDERPPDERIVTLNAWNEWTEGSYLEPDTKHGFAYLEAIRDVFGV